MGIRCADHVPPLYPQKLALTSPTGGGRSVGIVRSRTKATESIHTLHINSALAKKRMLVCSRPSTDMQFGLAYSTDTQIVAWILGAFRKIAKSDY